MKSKIIYIGIIGMFLLTGFINVSVADVITVLNDPGALGDAVDNENLVWTTGGSGSAVWSYQNDPSACDGDSARSALILDGQRCWISTTVEGPGKIYFSYKLDVSWEENWEGFLFFIDDNCWLNDVEAKDWTEYGYWNWVDEGEHTLYWEFYNDPLHPGGGGSTWLDNVRFYVLYKPETPRTPINSGKINVEYKFHTWTYDPWIDGAYLNLDKVYYMWDWGDGTYSEWIGPYNVCSDPGYYSGTMCTIPHIWTNGGTYNIRVKAKDTKNRESYWSDPLNVIISDKTSNDPPVAPLELSCSVNVESIDKPISFGTTTQDIDSDKIYFKFDWDDGTDSGWVGPYDSFDYDADDFYSVYCEIQHAWSKKGIYNIKVKAIDDPNGDGNLLDGAESEWCTTQVKVVIVKSSNKVFLPKFFELFPKAFPLLKQLLENIRLQ